AAEGGQLRDHQVQGGAHRPERFLGGRQIQPGEHGDAAAVVIDSEQNQAGLGVEAQQERDQGEQVLGAADVDGGSIGKRHQDFPSGGRGTPPPWGTGLRSPPPVARGGGRPTPGGAGSARVVGVGALVVRLSAALLGCLVRLVALVVRV